MERPREDREEDHLGSEREEDADVEAAEAIVTHREIRPSP
jgi:hypothetical protein